MDKIIYMLCTFTSLLCAVMLFRSYLQNKYRLLFWSGLCFVGLSTNNFLLIMDVLIFPATDLSVWRVSTTLVALLLLLFGLIWEG
ncbi:MAG: DUF5985 family protein [Gallionella sp.]|jgi:hypothetical protein